MREQANVHVCVRECVCEGIPLPASGPPAQCPPLPAESRLTRIVYATITWLHWTSLPMRGLRDSAVHNRARPGTSWLKAAACTSFSRSSNNGAALTRLQAGGVKVLEFPDSVWDAMFEASKSVYAEFMGDELFKKINDDYFASMEDSSGWLTKSIGAYRAQRDRVRA